MILEIEQNLMRLEDSTHYRLRVVKTSAIGGMVRLFDFVSCDVDFYHQHRGMGSNRDIAVAQPIAGVRLALTR